MKKKVIGAGDFLQLDDGSKGGTLIIDLFELSLTQNILDIGLWNEHDKAYFC
jgi:hypothetical protein